MSTTARELRLAYIAWMIVCIVWGTTYLGIRIALDTVPPALLGGLRFATAGVILLTTLAARGAVLPSRRSWPVLALLGGLLIGAGNGGVVWGEQYVPSGLAAVVVASGPFWIVAVEALLPRGERITAGAFAGLLVGFSGIVVLVWHDLVAGGAAAAQFLVGLGALQFACLGWAIGSSWSKRHSVHEDPLVVAAAEMLTGGLVMVALGTVRGEWTALHFTARTAGAMAYLVVAGSLVGFASYVYALKHLPVSFVSLYAYINPVIAVALGGLLLGERIDLRMLAGSAVIFVGLAIVRWSSRSGPKTPRRPVRACAAAGPGPVDESPAT